MPKSRVRPSAAAPTRESLKTVLRPRSAQGVGLDRPAAAPAPAYAPRNVQEAEPIDVGTFDPGSHGNGGSPLTQYARGSAMRAAGARAVANIDPYRARASQDRAIPASELETVGPVDERMLRGGPPTPRWRADDAVAPPQGVEIEMVDRPWSVPAHVNSAGDTEQDFDARIRQLGGQVPAAPVGQTLTGAVDLRPLIVDDVDRLWDWCRTEPDRAADFFGPSVPRSALDLHLLFRAYLASDEQGLTLTRAVTLNGQHIGFTILNPIDRQSKIACAHLYLDPAHRGHLATLIPAMLDAADRALPGDIRLAVYANKPKMAELLAPYGFEENTLLVRKRR